MTDTHDEIAGRGGDLYSKLMALRLQAAEFADEAADNSPLGQKTSEFEAKERGRASAFAQAAEMVKADALAALTVKGGTVLLPIDGHQLGHDPVAAFYRAFQAHYEHHGLYESFSMGWKALLAASPTPPAGAAGGERPASKIIAGMRDAVAFAQGDASRGKIVHDSRKEVMPNDPQGTLRGDSPLVISPGSECDAAWGAGAAGGGSGDLAALSAGAGERESEAPIYETFAKYVGNADERASDFRMFATGYHASLSAPIADLGAQGEVAAPSADDEGFFGNLEASYPNPTEADLADPQFNAVWQVIKHWDVNVRGAYAGYCGAMGNHVMAVLNAVRAANAELSDGGSIWSAL